MSHELSIGIFMGGGSGLSSPRSMTLDLLEEGFELSIGRAFRGHKAWLCGPAFP